MSAEALPRDTDKPPVRPKKVESPRGDTWIWFTGSALGMSLLMIVGLVAVILYNGLGFFWPSPLVKLTLKDGSVFLGEVVDKEPIPQPGTPEHDKKQRLEGA